MHHSKVIMLSCQLVQLGQIEQRNGILSLNWVGTYRWFLQDMGGMGLGHSMAALILAALTDDWLACAAMGWHDSPLRDGESVSSVGALGGRLWQTSSGELHTSSGELHRIVPSPSA